MKKINYEQPAAKVVEYALKRVVLSVSIGAESENYDGTESAGSWYGNNSGEGYTEERGRW